MNSKINVLLEALEGKSSSIYLLENKIKSAINSSGDLSDTVSEINNEMYLTKDLHGNRIPFYWFYLAIVFYKMDDYTKSKEALANSILGFRTQGLNLNEAIGELFFGIIHYKNTKTERAQRACKTASVILDNLIKQCELKRAYQKAGEYKKYLRKIQALNRLIKKQQAPVNKDELQHTYTSPQRDYLFLQWLPIYNNVRAGKKGALWESSFANNGTTIHEVELDEKRYAIFSIRSSEKIIDHQITLTNENSYYWVKVKGHSMNACKPTPIENGDYVLCSSTWDKNQDAIVIAGLIKSSQEISMMVKKYLIEEKILTSETTDTGEDYSPIELTQEYQILGTVLAVAKPAE